MKDIHYHLLLVSEESHEVGKACSKIIRFGADSIRNGETNLERLDNEFHDLYAALELMYETHYGKQLTVDRNKILKKKEKIAKYHKISKDIWLKEKFLKEHLNDEDYVKELNDNE